MDATFSSLFYLCPLSACACSFEVTVTSVSLPPFMSRRGLFNTNQRLSLTDIVINIIITSSRCPESLCCDAPPDPSYQRPYSPSPLRALVSLRLPLCSVLQTLPISMKSGVARWCDTSRSLPYHMYQQDFLKRCANRRNDDFFPCQAILAASSCHPWNV